MKEKENASRLAFLVQHDILRSTETMRLRFFSVFLCIATLVIAPFSVVFASTLPYAASAATASVAMKASETKTITLVFKNIGSETWIGGVHQTAVYVFGSSSVFGSPTWVKDDEPAAINQKTVKPGESATATFIVKAPAAGGTYTQKFLLSYATDKWIKGSTKIVNFVVSGGTPAATPVITSVPAKTPPVTPVVSPTPPSSTPSTTIPTTADTGEWKALLTDRGGLEWQVDPLGQATVAIAFQNTGTATWTKDGKNYVSLYTGTDSRKSVFKDTTWKSDTQVTVLQEASVKPGGTGHFTFYLRAPSSSGSYKESFQLAAEGKAWITGGAVTIPVRVTASTPMLTDNMSNGVDTSIVEAPPAAGTYQATMLLSSVKSVTLLGNGRQALTFGFKNIGAKVWNSLTLRLTGVTPALGIRLASVRDDSWLDASNAANTVKDTAPGEIGFIGFTLKAPAKHGSYNARFTLYANNQPVDGGIIDIPITVTADGYIEPEPTKPTPVVTTPKTTTPSTPTQNAPILTVQPVGGDASTLPPEPIIRVGLFKVTDNQMMVTSVSGNFHMQDAAGSTICRFVSGQVVTVSYDRSAAVSKASGPNCATQTSGYYVVVADDGISPLQLTDFSRPVSWLPGANDNTFRAKLELRYAKATDSVWIINELPIEWYLKGIGETSNSSPQQYQRALLTAARTYAMYHVQRGTKHAAENFTVDATYDQVYRGFGAEARDPNVVSAVDATRGQIVTYQGKLALTPYYSRSDGRTRSWTEVWGGGPYPWLVSVAVPWDNGKTLWGHGVGLSATGALGAAADGWTYDHILSYFYQGSVLGQVYK
jgi:peptidoglycan hydrolase-like amidase